MMKYINLLLFVLPIFSFAQTIQVTDAEAEIDQIKRKGIATTIELDKKLVEKLWLTTLKESGRVETNKTGSITQKAISIPSISASPMNIYSTLTTSQNGTTVFIAIDLGTQLLTPGTTEYTNAKQWLYNFALKAYLEDLNLQIAEADKAVDIAVRVHDKRIEKGNSLAKSLDRSRADQQRLERQLKEAEANHLRLKADSLQNLVEQATALDEINRLRKISEEKKTKLSGLR